MNKIKSNKKETQTSMPEKFIPDSFSRQIIHCKKCPRLIRYCHEITKTKKKAYLNEVYWGKPVPSFGSLQSQILIVGLAPAAHGANRTGRMFTGDRSGLWLYRALFEAGFSNQFSYQNKADGLMLSNVRITAIAHCAPPQNKPVPDEIKNCRSHLSEEIKAMPSVKIFLTLGQLALNNLWKTLDESIKPAFKIPKFQHGSTHALNNNKYILMSYHPSQQNTFTGKLTKKMFDDVFKTASQIIKAKS